MSMLAWGAVAAPTMLGAIAGGAGAWHRVDGWQLYVLSGILTSVGAWLVSTAVMSSGVSSDTSEDSTYDCSVDIVILEDGSNACVTPRQPYAPSMEEQFMEQTVLSGNSMDDTYPWFR